MGYELKRFTDQEWADLERIGNILEESTPERLERCFQEINACIEGNEAFFAMLPAILEI